VSNSRRLRRQTIVPSVLDQMTGHRMPGGCDDCSAFQSVEKQANGVYVLTVNHDGCCPFLRGVTR